MFGILLPYCASYFASQAACVAIAGVTEEAMHDCGSADAVGAGVVLLSVDGAGAAGVVLLSVDGAGAGVGDAAGTSTVGAVALDVVDVDATSPLADPPPPHPATKRGNAATSSVRRRFFGEGIVIVIKKVPFTYQLNEYFLMGNNSFGSPLEI
jgi:hypothetical protein